MHFRYQCRPLKANLTVHQSIPMWTAMLNAGRVSHKRRTYDIENAIRNRRTLLAIVIALVTAVRSAYAVHVCQLNQQLELCR